VVDTATNTVVNNFVAGYGPAGVAVVKTGSAAGNVFVANFGANSGPTSPYSGVPGTVSIYNPTTGVVQSLTVGLGSAGVAISNDGLWA
jgi:YVTN family beta-propeller protein